MKKFLYLLSALSWIGILVWACSTPPFRTVYEDANQLLYGVVYSHDFAKGGPVPVLKAHLKNGHVLIFNQQWQIDTKANIIIGACKEYDVYRRMIAQTNVRYSLDSILLYETNVAHTEPRVEKLVNLNLINTVSLMGGLGAAFVALQPLAFGQFGSCPTFYIHDHDNYHHADAETFSNAICPSMAYADVDALNNGPLNQKDFSITMKNEALETHVVEDVKLLAYPRQAGERIMEGCDHQYYICRPVIPVSLASCRGIPITGLVQHADRVEQYSLADASNLSSKEEILLTFDQTDGIRSPGLILHFRQTLMTTYFMYQAMAYMGDQVGDFFAQIESNPNLAKGKMNGIHKELGNIDVYAWDATAAKWKLQQSFYETGPIAINKQVARLQPGLTGGPLQLKLVLNKGLWRVDYVALTNIGQQVAPMEIHPASIIHAGSADPKALQEILEPGKSLTSMPGEAYQFNFHLPSAETDYELFLCARGYYLEWMRDEWVRQKNLSKLRRMLIDPQRYLREEATIYKKYETEIERDFWNEKISKPIAATDEK